MTAIKLLPCPFCGSEAVMRYIGNEHTKKRSINVRCSNTECRIERTDSAIRYSLDWLKPHAIAGWNRRARIDARLKTGGDVYSGYDFCPKCKGSFSFSKPIKGLGQNIHCPHCAYPLPPLPEADK